jgi:hypothetical protein
MRFGRFLSGEGGRALALPYVRRGAGRWGWSSDEGGFANRVVDMTENKMASDLCTRRMTPYARYAQNQGGRRNDGD